jgi:hypothetical protein
MIDPDPPAPLTDDFFDRVVEGDLSPAELRAALDRLEREPDGWKRCTLAFLEAQCWRESFKTIDPQSSGNGCGLTSSRPSASTQSSKHQFGLRRLAIAAGIAAMAFALGWRARPERTGSSHRAASPALANAGPPATRDLGTAIAPPSSVADRDPEKPAPPDEASPVNAARRVRVVPADTATAAPIVARRRLDERWVKNPSPPITEHQLALLEQRGYQVDRRRRVITATLADGRRVTMPIEQIQLRYTGVEPL